MLKGNDTHKWYPIDSGYICITKYDCAGNLWCITWYDHVKQMHRDNAPAKVWSTGQLEWYVRGTRCRGADKPAVLDEDGRMWWYHDDKLLKSTD